jgi:hypothetical protein
MDTFWSAVIGAGGTITAALIPALLARQASVRNKSYDKVTGSISNPQPDEEVRRTFKCSGVVTGMQPGLSLWLAVEVGDLVWPKESKVAPDQDNKWSATVFEDGATETFAIALFVADSKVDRRIGKWLEAGRGTGNYSELKGIPGVRRIARVDGLRLNPGIA